MAGERDRGKCRYAGPEASPLMCKIRLMRPRSARGRPGSTTFDGINSSLSFTGPSSMFRYDATGGFSPINYNCGHWANEEATALMRKARAAFNAAEQTQLLAKAHAVVVDEAPWLFIVHDLNPRAMSKKVQGFKPAQSWSQDFTRISMV